MPRLFRKSRLEIVDHEVDFGGVVDPDLVTREGVTVCPFGKGLVCIKPGCMVCDEGVRCCNPGDTCYLTGQDKTSWCAGFRGRGGGSQMAAAPAERRSFWER